MLNCANYEQLCVNYKASVSTKHLLAIVQLH